MNKKATTFLALVLSILVAQAAAALTIYDVQFSTPPDYASPYLGQTVDVAGGVVTKIFIGGRTKITIQDPTLGDAWAGVQVVFDDHAQAAGIVFGDQVDFFAVLVDEYRGNTQLGFSATSSFVINSSGNTVEPVEVTPADIPYPANHDVSEPYEFMLLQVDSVCVGAMDLGKAGDDYELLNAHGVCWASDYANSDLPPGSLYYVAPGECFASVTGILEQYYNPSSGWDYYQLLPRDGMDYVPESVAVEARSWGAVKALFR